MLEHDFEVMMPSDMDEHDDNFYFKDEMTPVDLTMTEHHRYYLTNAVCGSPFISEDAKTLLQDVVYGNENCDSNIRYRLLSKNRRPTHETKQKIWEQVTNLSLNISSFEYRAMCNGFI